MTIRDDPFNLATLRQAFVGSPLAELESVTSAKYLASLNHGDLPHWIDTLEKLPAISPGSIDLKSQVRVGSRADGNISQQTFLNSCLKSFMPWRKGPFTLFDIEIDSEWKSNLKWDRLLPSIQPIAGRKVLDVGCGNGYHCLRSAGEGADLVIGLEPYLIYVIQFLTIKRYLASQPCYVLPIRLDQFPGPLQYFDTVFSMGVLYHQKSPLDHLLQLKKVMRRGGELVLETLVVDGEKGFSLTPKKRYARMPNVWFIPSIDTLVSWLERCGFNDIKVVDTTTTNLAEQRKTEWMPYKSLGDSVDAADSSLTIEGLPAPKRSIVLASLKN